MTDLPSGTVTFLLTDIEGSTALWEEAPQTMRAALAKHDALFDAAVHGHRGVHIWPRGEGILASPSSPPRRMPPLRQSLSTGALDRALAHSPADQGTYRRSHRTCRAVRRGILWGCGNGCARLRGIGHGGQILLSQSAASLIEAELPTGASLVDLGEHRLRDISRPERVHQLVAPGLSTHFPPLISPGDFPTNLPLQLTPLIGREREIDVLQQFLLGKRTRLLTLTGSAGSVKRAWQLGSEWTFVTIFQMECGSRNLRRQRIRLLFTKR